MTARRKSQTPSPDPAALRLVGAYGDGIKITVRAAAEAGAANQAVLAVLADALDVGRANVRILRGHSNPRKEVLILGLSAEAIQQRLVGPK
jgi:uncharacterized protein YggU (UPF0235/DUF167 family)